MVAETLIPGVHSHSTLRWWGKYWYGTACGSKRVKDSTLNLVLDASVASQVAGSNAAREGTEQKALAQEELLLWSQYRER